MVRECVIFWFFVTDVRTECGVRKRESSSTRSGMYNTHGLQPACVNTPYGGKEIEPQRLAPKLALLLASNRTLTEYSSTE